MKGLKYLKGFKKVVLCYRGSHNIVVGVLTF